MPYPRVEISYAVPSVPVGPLSVTTMQIEPVASDEMTMTHTSAGFLLTAFSVQHDDSKAFLMSNVRRWGQWDESVERQLFEDACYTHYLVQREFRLVRNVPSLADHPSRPWTREEIFVKRESGDYIAVAYQQAWGGWKLARGA